MSASETAGKAPSRGLLIALGVVVVAALVYLAWPAATPQVPPSNQSRTARAQQQQATRAAGTLNVRLDALKQPPPQPANAERNPFRFQPKAPPPMPAGPGGRPGASGMRGNAPPPQVGPPPPPPIPPIPLKFIGTLDARGPGKVAIFVGSDGKGPPVYAREGQLVLGQYRVVKIGIESVVMEYADGRGRQTIPLRG